MSSPKVLIRVLAAAVVLLLGWLGFAAWRWEASRQDACRKNLVEIWQLAQVEAKWSSSASYPKTREGGIASLQVLVDSNPGLVPRQFICPASAEIPATPGPNGWYWLDGQHSSYQMVSWRMYPGDPGDAVIAHERSPNHLGKRAVLFNDGSVRLLWESEFQKVLAADQKRFELR